MNHSSISDSADWISGPHLYREGSISSSESASLLSSRFSTTPASSPTIDARKGSYASVSDEVERLELDNGVAISFVKNGKLFKLRYTFIDIWKNFNGALKCLELGGGVGQQTAFIHTFNNIKLPVPHLEHPKLPNELPLRVSFLEEQTVQTAYTLFSTQLSYTFGGWQDCVRFQESLLSAKLVFMAGIAEAKSKGRGEECISQNLRILRGGNDKVNPGKKAGRPVVLDLLPNFDILSQMKWLQIRFLDDEDRKHFCQLLSELQG
ncbi:hypothetical protein MPDQ_004100 [Monascus purpureus]|uniref:O-methyltransferase domain-containing protein n=1 Tax=Monascus purpureus TaxID=5098 RepID=A0A507R2A7_MONPU|nr:hypothetical protein MPDQ_004100 [Monascus purpureus]